MELSASSQAAQQAHAAKLRSVEVAKYARTVVVPTSIDEVKMILRSLGCPVTLFGEGPADRRVRLQETIAELEINSPDQHSKDHIQSLLKGVQNKRDTAPSIKKETFYTPADASLISFREALCIRTFEAAKTRLLALNAMMSSPDLRSKNTAMVGNLYTHCESLMLNSSQFAHERPLLGCRFSRATDFQSSQIASCSMGEDIKIWNGTNLNPQLLLKGHTERITSISWSNANSLASSSADGTCRVWSVPSSSVLPSADPSAAVGDGSVVINSLTSIQSLVGHEGIVQSCAFHPFDAHVATAGHDRTLRLWDVASGDAILVQEGLAREASVVDFHPDGSLLLSGDWSGAACLWDLRSSRRLDAFQGHAQKIVKSSFHPNGWLAATASPDNTVRVWDLRTLRCAYALPAHSQTVSDVRFSASGELLLTGSFDGSLRVWGSRDFRLLSTLSGHADKVMGVDFAPDERHLVSAGFDRTIKLWSHSSEF